jgi:hypothetical protein
VKLKQTYWDCEWSQEDDKALLIGIYEYGYGNWDWIKADPKLNLSQKILLNKMNEDIETGNNANNEINGSKRNKRNEKNIKLKPQSKHLRTRIDYLIKVLKTQINIEKFGSDWKENKVSKNSNNKSTKKSKKKSSKKKTNDFAISGINTHDQPLDNFIDSKLDNVSTNTNNDTLSTTRSNKRKLKSKSKSDSRSSKRKNQNGSFNNEHHNQVNKVSDESENSESNHEFNSNKVNKNNYCFNLY